MFRLDPQVAMHRLNINPETRQATAAMIPSRDNGSDPVGSQEAYRLPLHQGRTTLRLGRQYRLRYQEEWEDPGLY